MSPRSASWRAGDTVHLGQAASVQFAGRRAFNFRIIRELPYTTYDGWVWLDGYQLDQAGNAVQRRELFVIRAGIVSVPAPLSTTQGASVDTSTDNRVPAARWRRPVSGRA